MKRMKKVVLVAILGLASCQFSSGDSLVMGERHAQQGSFLQALTFLDKVAPSHPRYTEARTLAQALERRIRTSQEKILEGMTLRSEWRDEEAIDRFQQALDIWNDVVTARGLMQATQNRIAALGTVRGSPGAFSAETEPLVGEVTTNPIEPQTAPATPAGETRPVDPASAAETATEPGSEAADTSPGMDAQKVRRQTLLAQAQRVLRRGDMDAALDILEDLWDEAPGDRNVAGQLVRVLHQRALLAYGQGRLEAAIDDWQKVVRLQKGNDEVKAFMRAAETELAARRRR